MKRERENRPQGLQRVTNWVWTVNTHCEYQLQHVNIDIDLSGWSQKPIEKRLNVNYIRRKQSPALPPCNVNPTESLLSQQ